MNWRAIGDANGISGPPDSYWDPPFDTSEYVARLLASHSYCACRAEECPDVPLPEIAAQDIERVLDGLRPYQRRGNGEADACERECRLWEAEDRIYRLEDAA